MSKLFLCLTYSDNYKCRTEDLSNAFLSGHFCRNQSPQLANRWQIDVELEPCRTHSITPYINHCNSNY